MNAANGRVRISPVREADIGPLLALARETWYQHYPGIITVAQIDYMLAQRYGEDAIRAQLAAAGAWWDKLEAGGRLAGFANYARSDAPDSVKLDKLYVHPRFQGGGLGSALLAHVERASAQRGFDRVWLQVNRNNAPAIAAYRRNGYRVARSASVDIGRGFVMDDYIMEKSLATAARRHGDAMQADGRLQSPATEARSK